ncbi:MAG: hypothetical protein JXA18_09730 [Chitinispirillaceae bacterium]|nr:hypothetical protein [Chitinispirillaceae bacterium]
MKKIRRIDTIQCFFFAVFSVCLPLSKQKLTPYPADKPAASLSSNIVVVHSFQGG